MTARDIARLAALGLVASVQPAFDAAWGGPAGMYATRLGRGPRGAASTRSPRFVDGGVPLALGSDSPVTPFDPWGAIRAGVLHQEPGTGSRRRGAIHAHTAGGHRAAGRDGGVLRPGAEATFTVWRSVEEKPGLPDFTVEEEPPECVSSTVLGGPGGRMRRIAPARRGRVGQAEMSPSSDGRRCCSRRRAAAGDIAAIAAMTSSVRSRRARPGPTSPAATRSASGTGSTSGPNVTVTFAGRRPCCRPAAPGPCP